MVPDKDDIVVRKKRGNPFTIYFLGTIATPEQLFLQNHDDAVSQAVTFAKQRRVRAWFNSEDTFVLLGAYCDDE